MKVQLRFFASVRERLGRQEEEVDLPSGATVGDLQAGLSQRYPDLAGLGSSISFAVNQEYVDSTRRLQEGDEVALIPPVSGG